MRGALSRAGRLHRDISLGNLVLVREPGQVTRRGYLIDWDASCDVDESGEAIETGRAVSFSQAALRWFCFDRLIAGDLALHVEPNVIGRRSRRKTDVGG